MMKNAAKVKNSGMMKNAAPFKKILISNKTINQVKIGATMTFSGLSF